jgi:hypothetical protein
MIRRKIKPILRETLLDNLDGLTVNELIKKTGVDGDYIRKTLRSMEDVYIDRWYISHRPNRTQAVYCIVKVPEDCPRPTRKQYEKRVNN